jgi:hypothetical protein
MSETVDRVCGAVHLKRDAADMERAADTMEHRANELLSQAADADMERAADTMEHRANELLSQAADARRLAGDLRAEVEKIVTQAPAALVVTAGDVYRHQAMPEPIARLAAAQQRRRWEMFLERFPAINEMRVLDLGGSAPSWLAGPARPAELVLVNLPAFSANDARHVEGVPWMRSVPGDACQPGPGWGRFDLVYSNSVIEHVGGLERRERFAETVHAHADRHWVQTPYRYFPIEPHYRLPFVQHLPTGVRAELVRRWPYAAMGPRHRAEPVADMLAIELLAFTDFRHYFPDSEIVVERLVGLPKSMIATR